MDKAKELAEAHWEYVEGILRIHNGDDEGIAQVRYHYITALIHGYKHGIEDGNYEKNLQVNHWLELMKHIDEEGPKLTKHFDMTKVRELFKDGIPPVTCSCGEECKKKKTTKPFFDSIVNT